MPEPVTKRLQVTFNTGLPLGTRGTFTHEGESWIALPNAKYIRLLTVIDRLVGALAAVQKQMTAWLASNPGDAQRVAMLLAAIAHADNLRQELTVEKCKAVTA